MTDEAVVVGRTAGSVPAGSTPKVAGVVGSPAQLASSLSPAIHNAAFKAASIDWVYLAFGMDAGWVVRGIRGLALGGIAGMNVTLPHKVAAVEAMDSLSDAAARIGAINTVEVRGGKLVGWNTDGEGLIRFLRMDAGASIEGSDVVLMGAGGSARAATHALASAGAGRITVLARDKSKAEALAPLAAGALFEARALEQVPEATIRGATIIINATPLGQRGEEPAIQSSAISREAIVVDLVYRPPVTPLVRAARMQGAVGHSGLGMLLHQAALAFEIWTGVPPPMDVMSAAALAELKRASG